MITLKARIGILLLLATTQVREISQRAGTLQLCNVSVTKADRGLPFRVPASSHQYDGLQRSSQRCGGSSGAHRHA
jgi:hypothetical protein